MARAKIGEKLTVDSTYLNGSMKRIITETYKGLRNKYANSEELHRIISEL
jgi:hypothetical protein